MGGGKAPAAPQPTEEEKALQREQAEQLKIQTEILQEQRDLNKLLLVPTLKAGGFDVELDDKGNLISVTEESDELQAQRREIEKGFLDRTQAALKGELPENPALVSDLREQRESLEEKLRRQLGTGYETTDAGITALSQFGEFETGVLEGSRRGDLSLAEGLGLARENAALQQQQANFGNVFNLREFHSPNASGFGSAAAGFGNAQQPFQHQRNMQFQSNIAASQQSSPFGSIFGTVLGGFAGNPAVGARLFG